MDEIEKMKIKFFMYIYNDGIRVVAQDYAAIPFRVFYTGYSQEECKQATLKELNNYNKVLLHKDIVGDTSIMVKVNSARYNFPYNYMEDLEFEIINCYEQTYQKGEGEQSKFVRQVRRKPSNKRF